MSRKAADPDRPRRKRPPQEARRKRAVSAARHRWKEKYHLVPGIELTWGELSYANKLRHLEAVHRGGATNRARIAEQADLFWRFVHGNSKEKLSGPFKAVVETFEKIEADYAQRIGYSDGSKWLNWDGFFARMLHVFVYRSCRGKAAEDLESAMWALYRRYMEADTNTLFSEGLLADILRYDRLQEEKHTRLSVWRANRSLSNDGKS